MTMSNYILCGLGDLDPHHPDLGTKELEDQAQAQMVELLQDSRVQEVIQLSIAHKWQGMVNAIKSATLQDVDMMEVIAHQ